MTSTAIVTDLPNGKHQKMEEESATPAATEPKNVKLNLGEGSTESKNVSRIILLGVVLIAGLTSATVALAVAYASTANTSTAPALAGSAAPQMSQPWPSVSHLGANPCEGKKPKHASPGDNYFSNTDCLVDGVAQVLEQAAANVTAGYKGLMSAGDREPITEPYFTQGMCPVNVHWHLGAEHLSEGQFDSHGTGPAEADYHRQLAAGKSVRKGFQCHKYNPHDSRFTTPYEWKHCVDMVVGETYEVHWPHSAAGMCGTPHQYQHPFYDGVFCVGGIISLDPLNTYKKIGVQGQVFTIINDEAYYVPDLIRGMIVEGNKGSDIAKYTGSTTGTSRDNQMCSRYTPITWQVDRTCHLISASSFDKLCADMKDQRDDMSGDLYAHGSRELVANHLAADNLQRRKA